MATLSGQRVWIEDHGNTEIYSHNESFQEGTLWKLSILPPESNNELEVNGQIEKLQDGVPVTFDREEAQSALYGTFLRASDVRVS